MRTRRRARGSRGQQGARAGIVHGGRIASCRKTPSRAIGLPLTGSTATWKRRVRAGPRQNRLTGWTRRRAIPTVPGSTIVEGPGRHELELEIRVRPGDGSLDGYVAVVVDGTSWLAPRRAVGRPRADLGRGVVELARPRGSPPRRPTRPGLPWTPPGHLGPRPGHGRPQPGRRITKLAAALGPGEERQAGGLDRRPARGIAKHLETELVDDRAGVADA